MKSGAFPHRVSAHVIVMPSVGRVSPAEASQPNPSTGYGARAASAHSAVQKSAAASQLKLPAAKLLSKVESAAQESPATGAAVVVGAAVLDAGGGAVVEAAAVVDAAAENGIFFLDFKILKILKKCGILLVFGNSQK